MRLVLTCHRVDEPPDHDACPGLDPDESASQAPSDPVYLARGWSCARSAVGSEHSREPETGGSSVAAAGEPSATPWAHGTAKTDDAASLSLVGLRLRLRLRLASTLDSPLLCRALAQLSAPVAARRTPGSFPLSSPWPRDLFCPHRPCVHHRPRPHPGHRQQHVEDSVAIILIIDST